MSAAAIAPPAPQRNVSYPGCRPRRWTRDEYYRAAEAGLFRPDERLELLNGEIIEKVTENAPHSSGIRRTRSQLEAAFRAVACFFSEQHPISLPDDSEPEPDLAVVSGSLAAFDNRHPGPADLLLVVEVSNTTLEYDRDRKAPVYAAAGIHEYWILNLRDRQVEVFRNPQNGAYQTTFDVPETQTVSPLAVARAVLRVADLLPSP